MKRIALVGAMVALLMVLFAPAALAAEGRWDQGEVLIAVNGPVNIPPGDHLETLVVIDGNAEIGGEIDTIIVAGGTATLSDATTETLVVLDATVELGAGTTVLGDVRTLDGTVNRQAGAVVNGTVRGLGEELAAFTVLMIPLLILLFLGIAVVAVAAALVVAAFAARQTREVEALISEQPGQVLVAGIAGLIAVPLAAVLLMVTVIGAPIGFIVLFIALPAVLVLAWIMAAIWIGDWLVARLRGSREPERPYLAAVLGVVTLAVAGMLPFVTAIATLFGFGALLLSAWRVLRRRQTPVGGLDAMPAAPSAS